MRRGGVGDSGGVVMRCGRQLARGAVTYSRSQPRWNAAPVEWAGVEPRWNLAPATARAGSQLYGAEKETHEAFGTLAPMN